MPRKELYTEQDDETKIANFKIKLDRQEIRRLTKLIKEKEQLNTEVNENVNNVVVKEKVTKFRLTDDPEYAKKYYIENKDKIKARYNAPERKEWYENHKKLCRERYAESSKLYKKSLAEKYWDTTREELDLMWSAIRKTEL